MIYIYIVYIYIHEAYTILWYTIHQHVPYFTYFSLSYDTTTVIPLGEPESASLASPFLADFVMFWLSRQRNWGAKLLKIGTGRMIVHLGWLNNKWTYLLHTYFFEVILKWRIKLKSSGNVLITLDLRTRNNIQDLTGWLLNHSMILMMRKDISFTWIFETRMLQQSPTSWQTQQAATVGATRTSRKTLSSTDEPLLFLGAGWIKLANLWLMEMSFLGLYSVINKNSQIWRHDYTVFY